MRLPPAAPATRPRCCCFREALRARCLLLCACACVSILLCRVAFKAFWPYPLTPWYDSRLRLWKLLLLTCAQLPLCQSRRAAGNGPGLLGRSACVMRTAAAPFVVTRALIAALSRAGAFSANGSVHRPSVAAFLPWVDRAHARREGSGAGAHGRQVLTLSCCPPTPAAHRWRRIIHVIELLYAKLCRL